MSACICISNGVRKQEGRGKIRKKGMIERQKYKEKRTRNNSDQNTRHISFKLCRQMDLMFSLEAP